MTVSKTQICHCAVLKKTIIYYTHEKAFLLSPSLTRTLLFVMLNYSKSDKINSSHYRFKLVRER